MTKKHLTNWLIYRIGGAKAATVGIVKAATADAAIKAAIKEYNLDDRDAARLMARPC